MKCPHCNNVESRVVETRENRDQDVTRRRRECRDCGDRFTTYERVEPPTLQVVKSDGDEEAFSEEKLTAGIEKACKKRPVDGDTIDELVNDITIELRSSGRNRVDSSEIGDMVIGRLKELDEVAYLRFASIYRSFDDVSAFKDEVETLETNT